MGIGKKKEHEKYACLDSLNDSISDNKKKERGDLNEKGKRCWQHQVTRDD
jgi:hypothetical protein